MLINGKWMNEPEIKSLITQLIADKERLQKRLTAKEQYEVTECCPHCDSEVSLIWDIEEDGYHAYCPYCGNRLMLCSMCPGTTGTMHCDYDSKTDSCTMQKKAGE